MTPLPVLRRALCRAAAGGLRTWLSTYFTDEAGDPLVISRGQQAWVDDLERVLRRDPGDAIRGLAAMCARGHGKSTTMKGAVLYALVVMTYRYAALLTAGTVYEQFSRDIRSIIRGEGPLVRSPDGRALLVTDWDIRPSSEHPVGDERLWNIEDFKFYVGGWARTDRRRVAVRGLNGGNGNVRGLVDGVDRPDLLWADDPMKDAEAANMDVTERVKTFVKAAYWPCGGPDARVVTTGTPFNDRDLISEQVGSPADWPNLLRWRLPAVHPVSGALFLPHYWTRERLEARRELIGSRAYAEGYLLDPQGGGVRIFEPAWIERWMSSDVPPLWDGDRRRVHRVMFTDPSLGRSAKSDTSAIIVLDYDRSTKRGCIRHASIARRRPQVIVEDELALWQHWQPDAHAVEDEGAQELLIPSFQALVEKRALPKAAIPRLQGAGGTPKVLRIKRLSPLIEFGRLWFDAAGEHRELRIQATMYQGKLNGDEVDDGPDALEGAWRLATAGLAMGVN